MTVWAERLNGSVLTPINHVLNVVRIFMTSNEALKPSLATPTIRRLFTHAKTSGAVLKTRNRDDVAPCHRLGDYVKECGILKPALTENRSMVGHSVS